MYLFINPSNHGVRHMGGQGAMPPPQILLEGASNAFGPPDFRKNYVMFNQLMNSDSVFSLKKTMECTHNTVHFIKNF